MKDQLETLDPSTLPSSVSAVTYDPKSQMVTLPGGVVSVAGVTVVTGGTELSCVSCMMAFGVWGVLIGVSVVALGLWHQTNLSEGRSSHLLGLGWVILAVSLAVVGSVVGLYLLSNKRRERREQAKKDGKILLMDESGTVIKKVTV